LIKKTVREKLSKIDDLRNEAQVHANKLEETKKNIKQQHKELVDFIT
jgi:uncharacterized coiled-coil DUF342 family protein